MCNLDALKLFLGLGSSVRALYVLACEYVFSLLCTDCPRQAPLSFTDRKWYAYRDNAIKVSASTTERSEKPFDRTYFLHIPFTNV